MPYATQTVDKSGHGHERAKVRERVAD